MKFFLFVTSLFLFSFNSLAEVKCFKELRALEEAIQSHNDATDAVAADSLTTSNYLMGVAIELMSQQNGRVGGYGYGIKASAESAIYNVTTLHGRAKAAEKKVKGKIQEVEDCLIGN